MIQIEKYVSYEKNIIIKIDRINFCKILIEQDIYIISRFRISFVIFWKIPSIFFLFLLSNVLHWSIIFHN